LVSHARNLADSFRHHARCLPESPRVRSGRFHRRIGGARFFAPLEGTEWRLVDIGGQPSPAGADSTRHPGFTLLAEGRKVQGSAGCNRMTGTYKLDGEKLKFGPLATTRMACPAMQTETAFLKALKATTRFEVSGSSLMLYGADTAVARLEAAANPS
jgi:heat shock protein HslJ